MDAIEFIKEVDVALQAKKTSGFPIKGTGEYHARRIAARHEAAQLLDTCGTNDLADQIIADRPDGSTGITMTAKDLDDWVEDFIASWASPDNEDSTEEQDRVEAIAELRDMIAVYFK